MGTSLLERLQRVYLRVGGCCTYCGRALMLHEAHLDHDEGGSHLAIAAEDQLRCACGECQAEKGERTAAEYRHIRRTRQALEMLSTLAAR